MSTLAIEKLEEDTHTADKPAKTGWRELWPVIPFRNLWLGQTISQLGDALYYLVFLFMVEKLTGDPRMVGITGVAQSLPFLLLSPHAGVVADRSNRRNILLRADLLSAQALAIFAVYVWQNPTPPAWTLVAMGALLSTINVFFAPAKSAAIPQVVPPHLLMSANALSLATQNLMPLLGVALSGTVLAALYVFSPTYFFVSAIALNAVSFALSALFIRRLPSLIPDTAPTEKSGLARAWEDLRDGVGYLRSQRVLWIQLLLNTAIWVAVAPFMLVYIQVNRDWFGGGYGTLALCEVSFFLGVVLCSLFIERLKIVRVGLAFIGGAVGLGITIALMALAHNVYLFAFWNLAAGLAFPFVQVPMTGYIQRVVPESFQGRVNSVLSMAGMGLQPLGIGLGGLLLAAIGPEWLIAGMGLTMTAAALVGLADPTFRNAR